MMKSHLQEMDGTNIKQLIFLVVCSGSFERKTSIHDTETREAHKPKPKKKAVKVLGEYRKAFHGQQG